MLPEEVFAKDSFHGRGCWDLGYAPQVQSRSNIVCLQSFQFSWSLFSACKYSSQNQKTNVAGMCKRRSDMLFHLLIQTGKSLHDTFHPKWWRGHRLDHPRAEKQPPSNRLRLCTFLKAQKPLRHLVDIRTSHDFFDVLRPAFLWLRCLQNSLNHWANWGFEIFRSGSR